MEHINNSQLRYTQNTDKYNDLVSAHPLIQKKPVQNHLLPSMLFSWKAEGYSCFKSTFVTKASETEP